MSKMNKQYILRSMIVCIMLSSLTGELVAQNKTGDSAFAEKEPGRLFQLQKRTSTAAVSTVTGETLYKTPTPNLTNTLYGRLSGLTVTQRSGEPGNDAALLGIRGVGSYGFLGGANGYSTYKIFVDGFETNDNYFRNLSPAEIESVSVLKDAAALATFGMRGANGVIWVTTKRGKIGKPTIQFQTRTGIQSAINVYKPLNSYDYANLYNQAISNDNGAWTPKYTQDQLNAYKNGTGTNVNWYDQVLKKNAPYTDADLIFSGGDSLARYNVVMDYAGQKGLYNVPNSDSTSNETFRRYNIRTNLDFNLFKIFEARVDIGGRIEDRKEPNYATDALWNDMASYPANTYNVYDSIGRWSGTTLYPNNPVASTRALGWASTHTRILQGNFSLKERLDMITPGLYMSQAYSFNSYTVSGYNKTATYARYNNGAVTTTDQTTPLKATAQTPNGQEDWKQATASIGYDRVFGDHQVHSAVNYHQSDYRGDGNYSFAYHYQNVSGRVHYGYKSKYFAEFGFSYFGSDAYAPGNRWGFYPAVSAAWIISSEKFLAQSHVIDFLKLRASAGKTGSADTDGSGSPQGQNGRYLYQQYYQAGSPTGSFYTGNGTPNGQALLSPLYIANPDIFAEQSMKYNVGVDINLVKKVAVTLDVFMDKRTGIITRDNSVPGSYGINTIIKNLGKQTNKGFEATATYNDKIGRVGYSVTGMAAYNKNTIDYMAEVLPANAFSAATGRPYGTPIGLVATGYYQLSDFNADGSLKQGIPTPSFGAVQPGDIRYADLDNNGRVDDNDKTAIGKAMFPQLTYAFGANINYAGFDLGVFFQGVHGTSVNILNSASIQTQAFVNNGNAYDIAKGAWAYFPDQGIDTRASATYPRLTTKANNNNYRTSSYWMKSGDFLRIRNAELGYTFSDRLMNKIGVKKLRIYVSAMNPVTWSSLLKNYHMDPETVTGYPSLKSYNTGITVTF